jgi:endonuclease YncB( thermonuclease family)
MRRRRRLVVMAWVGVFLALAGVTYPVLQAVTHQAAAQDGTNPTGTTAASPTPEPTATAEATPVATVESSPGASPVVPVASPFASPVAVAPQAEMSSFVSGQWRVAVAFATRADAVPTLKLAARDGRDWIVVVADVSNWASGRARFDPRGFGIRFAGSDEMGGLSQNLSEAAAEILSFDEIDFGEGVQIASEDTARMVLVFRLDDTGVDPFLVHEDGTVPLSSLLAPPEALTQLPVSAQLPELEELEVTDVPDGATLELEGQPVRLAGIDAPLPGECFAGQALRRLERLAGDEVLVERIPNADAAYIWIEDGSGVRSMLNYSMISGGSAAYLEGTPGPFATWLRDGDRIARNQAAGLWGACTSQHGTGRNLEPETATVTIRSDGETRPYEVWLAWSPLIVTKPNGSAWVFFSAEATEGADAGKKKLFSSRYDPASGKWSTARAMQGGDVQMGPSAVVDVNGVVHVVYCDRAGRNRIL